jgi:hypothetical protein
MFWRGTLLSLFSVGSVIATFCFLHSLSCLLHNFCSYISSLRLVGIARICPQIKLHSFQFLYTIVFLRLYLFCLVTALICCYISCSVTDWTHIIQLQDSVVQQIPSLCVLQSLYSHYSFRYIFADTRAGACSLR